MASASPDFRKNRHEKGFTLVEVLVSIGILGILVILLSQVFLSLMSTYVRSQMIQRMRTEGGRVMEIISRHIREAESIELVGGGVLELKNSRTSVFYVTGEEYVRFSREVFGTSPNDRAAVTKETSSTTTFTGSGSVITNDDLRSGVWIESLTFTLEDDTAGISTIRIDLSMRQPNGIPSSGRWASSLSMTSTARTRTY